MTDKGKNMEEKYYIGVDLGGTNIKAGMVTDRGKVIVKTSLATEADRGPDHVLDRICEAVEGVRKKSGLSKEHIGGVGVGSPGTLDIESGVVLYPPNLPGWRNVPVIEYVSNKTNLKAVLENDANAAAYGEYWAGAAKGARSMVMFTLGTGIGGGIIVDGKLIHGNTDCAAELGHIIIEVDGRQCPCGNYGCLERYASANAVALRFAEAVAEGEESVLAEKVKAGEDVSSKMIYEAAVDGDKLANRILWETGTYLGIGIVSLLHTINPARVVLSGGLIGAGDLLMRPVRETVEKRALPDALRNCTICFATLGEDAGLIGAAGCALAAFAISQS
ncbi:MAG: ROK family protein [Planctomycetota bacterium]